MGEIRYEVTNETRGRALASDALRASSFFGRLKGLLGRAALGEGEALHLLPCDSIHTFFMRFPIDVLFLDREGRIVAFEESLVPWRATWRVRGAASVLELPAGIVRATATRAGDRLTFRGRELDRASAIR